MQPYRREFLEFAIQREVLRFGSFTLKSGRVSPYFFNAGLFDTGRALSRLGRFYAATIQASGIAYDMLFGPAYKGIPLVAAVSIALAEHYDRDVPFAFNRKEVKDHAEGGRTVGAPIEGRVLIVDDVISAGTSVREAVGIIDHQGGVACGVAIALDRQERGVGDTSAVQEVRHLFGLQVVSIATVSDLIDLLAEQPGQEDEVMRMRAYRARYGVQTS
jgi:orotate phosphoribosyltransferase